MAKSARTKPAPDRKKIRRRKKIKVFLTLSLMFLMLIFIVGSVFAYQRLQKAELIVNKLDTVIQDLNSRPSRIESTDGEVLYEIQSEYRKAVPRSDIPQRVVNAMVAAEDKRFWDHPGIDFWSLMRILFVATKERSTRESGGGSTLTMQIAKRVFTGDAPTIERKLDNMALAIVIERKMTKDQILELYMNQVFFGQQAYGISAAADVYFGKSLDDLTVAEAAMLARCVRRPSDENPVANLDKATKNRNVVLAIMREEGYIDQKEYQEAKEEPVKLRAKRPQVVTKEKVHPYFVDYVLNELAKKGIDISAGGYRVVTTLNSTYQTIAEKGVVKWVKNLKGYRVNQMAILVTDNAGRIVSMVGGPDYQKSEFNMMWMGPGRQPGSSFKPFVYAAGLDRGVFDEGTTISTKPMKKPFSSEYFQGGANRGQISISTALTTSNNTAAVRAIDEVGESNTVAFCKRSLGFKKSNLPAVMSLALGSGEVYMPEMAEAYSVFQSHGDRYPVYAVSRVIHPDGSEESMVPKKARAVMNAAGAEYIDLCLRQNVLSGTGTHVRSVINARGKTGTTNDHKDAWFCGYTDQLIGIAWVANEQIVNGRPVATPMRGLFGGEGPARVWNDILRDIQKKMGEKSRPFNGVRSVTVKEEPDDIPEEPVDEPPVVDPGIPDEPPVDPNLVKDPNETKPPVSPPKTTGGTGQNQDVVYVSVCADSGQRANAYCPETVRRPFFKGSEPKGVCPLHGPTFTEVLTGHTDAKEERYARATSWNRKTDFKAASYLADLSRSVFFLLHSAALFGANR